MKDKKFYIALGFLLFILVLVVVSHIHIRNMTNEKLETQVSDIYENEDILATTERESNDGGAMQEALPKLEKMKDESYNSRCTVESLKNKINDSATKDFNMCLVKYNLENRDNPLFKELEANVLNGKEIEQKVTTYKVSSRDYSDMIEAFNSLITGTDSNFKSLLVKQTGMCNYVIVTNEDIILFHLDDGSVII